MPTLGHARCVGIESCAGGMIGTKKKSIFAADLSNQVGPPLTSLSLGNLLVLEWWLKWRSYDENKLQNPRSGDVWGYCHGCAVCVCAGGNLAGAGGACRLDAGEKGRGPGQGSERQYGVGSATDNAAE